MNNTKHFRIENKAHEYYNKSMGFLGLSVLAGVFFFAAMIDFLSMEMDTYYGVLMFSIPFPVCLILALAFYILYKRNDKLSKILSKL